MAQRQSTMSPLTGSATQRDSSPASPRSSDGQPARLPDDPDLLQPSLRPASSPDTLPHHPNSLDVQNQRQLPISISRCPRNQQWWQDRLSRRLQDPAVADRPPSGIPELHSRRIDLPPTPPQASRRQPTPFSVASRLGRGEPLVLLDLPSPPRRSAAFSSAPDATPSIPTKDAAPMRPSSTDRRHHREPSFLSSDLWWGQPNPSSDPSSHGGSPTILPRFHPWSSCGEGRSPRDRRCFARQSPTER
ncbi:hypothetical protein MLD38_021095 [Melastoma candidum]|uniref:Uncharacterized protein n=1 Tax=Melastoma candidum TaxID=119954 RepID=A0ACB9QIE8_9MYRT|nr:hypothetical protein MLD38_021095 [Melastoma candidum]